MAHLKKENLWLFVCSDASNLIKLENSRVVIVPFLNCECSGQGKGHNIANLMKVLETV